MNRERLSKAFLALYDVMTRLRGPDGCPWDAQQTDETVKMYLLEEAYEVLDAIEKGSPEDVCHELGDLLFQILFLAKLAEEEGTFDFLAVLENINHKMIRRHPHVFGNEKVKGPEEVAENWARIKKSEKGGGGRSISSHLDSVPTELPALLRAHRLSERATSERAASGSATKEGVGRESSEGKWEKVERDFDEVRQAVSDQENGLLGEKMGSLLFSLSELARHFELNAENALRHTNQKFLEGLKKL